MRRALLFLAILLPIATGCDSGGDGAPEIGGTYSYSETSSDGVTRLSIKIPDTDGGAFTLQSGSAVSYTGTDGTTISFPVTGTGTYSYPNIQMSLTLSTGGSGDTQTVSGTVNESGSSLTLRDPDGATIILTR